VPEPDTAQLANPQKPLLFLSYARRDASDLADRLKCDLEADGYRVWLDRPEIKPGGEWEHKIVDGLRAAQLLVALLTPSAVRRSTDLANADAIDSVCLDEISFARFATPPTAVVPVMAQPCEPPFSIFRLDYVDMCAWRDSEDRYQAGLQRLLAGIEEALGGKVTYRSQINDLQPWDFAAFLYEKRRDFCGREWLFDEIDLWLKSSPDPALLITGDPGTGKSALVAELVHRNPGGQVIAYHCCQADVLATIEPARFVRSIAAMIASQLPSYAARLNDPPIRSALAEETCGRDPFSAFDSGVLTPLQAILAPDDELRYLLIDALDESLPHGAQSGGGTIVDLLSTFIERMPGWLRLVATTRKEPAVLQRLAGLRAREIAAQDRRNIDDIQQYLRQQLQTPDLSQQLVQTGLSLDDAIARLCQHSGGNFLYAQQVCTGLARGLYRLSDLEAVPTGLNSHYRRFFLRQFPDPGVFETVRPALETLVAADTPLSRKVLSNAIETDEMYGLSGMLRPLGGFVVSDESGLRLFHRSLADWLTDPARVGDLFHVDINNGRRRLTDSILAATADKADWVRAMQLRESLLRQLVATAQWEKFDELTADLSFVKSVNTLGWSVLFPQLVQSAPVAQRDHLRTLPRVFANMGWTLAKAGDDGNAVFMFYRAFDAIVGLVKRDHSTAPWLSQLLVDLTDVPEDLSKYLYHVGLTSERQPVSDYADIAFILLGEAINLVERAGLAVPERASKWRDGMRTRWPHI
jgi:hypothetical protein